MPSLLRNKTDDHDNPVPGEPEPGVSNHLNRRPILFIDGRAPRVNSESKALKTVLFVCRSLKCFHVLVSTKMMFISMFVSGFKDLQVPLQTLDLPAGGRRQDFE